MNSDNARFVIGGVLLIHGLGHGGALGALLWIRAFPSSPTGGWLAARSWLAPALNAPEASLLASAFWIVAMLGFVASALSFWEILVPADIWRQLGVGSALVSLTGMVVFFGTWPAFNWIASLMVNVAVLVTQLVTKWPAQELLKR